MTAGRRRRKLGLACCALLVGVCGYAALMPMAGAALTEAVVVDRHSGLALSGFDPVAYFTDGDAVLGRPELEATVARVTWRFRNEGNRAAFVANPETYMPQFGGYDPVAAGRQVATPGHPQLWLIADGRLYLFYSPQARAEFAAAPEKFAMKAERGWPTAEAAAP